MHERDSGGMDKSSRTQQAKINDLIDFERCWFGARFYKRRQHAVVALRNCTPFLCGFVVVVCVCVVVFICFLGLPPVSRNEKSAIVAHFMRSMRDDDDDRQFAFDVRSRSME